MKLNYRRTVLVGMAFLSICAFWQLYDNVVPLILKNTFNIPDGAAGVIMALDNVLALFMLPLFGTLSDRNTKSRLGKRTPFIILGTIFAVVLMNLLPAFDNRGSFVLFIVALGLLLITMGTYRSPAVALMPDITPKPLRSKANAVINLMGALGGVYTLLITGFLVKKGASGRDDYTLLFLAVSALMVVAVILLVTTIREKKLAALVPDDDKETEKAPDKKTGSGFAALSPGERRSLICILAAVALWFMGYNAVTTAFTKYVFVRWGYDIKAASQCLMVGTVSAVIGYIPTGLFATKFGRKRVIQAGALLLTASFAAGAMFNEFSPLIYGVFACVGIAWAMINVNSYPMVVEISKSADVGRFTGYYYTASMAAQIATPIISGFLLQYVGYWTLMPYAAVMVALSFMAISLAKHGDSKPEAPRGIEAFDTDGDA